MDLEPFDFAETLRQRRESAAASVQETTHEEAIALVKSLTTDHESTIGPDILRFIAEHQTETVYRGQTSDGIEFLYFPKARRGLWHAEQNGVRSAGKLAERAMTTLDEILAERA